MLMTLKLGKGLVRTVDLVKVPGLADFTESTPLVARHLVRKGLENVIKDTHANFKIKDTPDYMAKSIAAVDNKITALYAGDIRISDEINAVAMKKDAVAKATLEDVMANKTEEEIEQWTAELIARSKAKKKANG